MASDFENFVLDQLRHIDYGDLSTAERNIGNELVQRGVARWEGEGDERVLKGK